MNKKPDDRGNITGDEIHRYLKGEISGEERNAFERRLERDPFAYEAVEGLEGFKPREVLKDLEDIRGQLQPRKRHPAVMWRIAAVVALMVLAGVSAWRLTTEEPNRVTRNSEAAADTATLAMDDPLPTAEANEQPASSITDDSPSEPTEVEPNGMPASVAGLTAEQPDIEEQPEESQPEEVFFEADEVIPEHEAEYYAEEKLVAEAAEQEKLAQQAAEKTKAEKEALAEVLADQVVPATEAPRRQGFAPRSRSAASASETPEAAKKMVTPSAENASPDMGWAAFREFLSENQQKKDDMVDGQVGLSFIVGPDGIPDSIRVIEPLCPSCDDEAVRLLKISGRWSYYNTVSAKPDTYVKIPIKR